MYHYYRPGRRKPKPVIIADYIRGVTVEFYVSGQVFSSRRIDEGTKLLIETAIIEDRMTVLDIGCGYGVIGITLAKAYPNLKVYMTDVNPVAVKLAKLNAKINGVENRVNILQGDLYKPIKDMKFDTILSNPPLSAGWKIVGKIIEEAPQHLNKRGLLQMVFKKGSEKAKTVIENTGLDITKILKKRGYTVIIAEKQ